MQRAPQSAGRGGAGAPTAAGKAPRRFRGSHCRGAAGWLRPAAAAAGGQRGEPTRSRWCCSGKAVWGRRRWCCATARTSSTTSTSPLCRCDRLSGLARVGAARGRRAAAGKGVEGPRKVPSVPRGGSARPGVPVRGLVFSPLMRFRLGPRCLHPTVSKGQPLLFLFFRIRNLVADLIL